MMNFLKTPNQQGILYNEKIIHPAAQKSVPLLKGAEVMDNEKLNEIKYNIAALPTLENRMNTLKKSIYDAENEVQSLLAKYELESLDVEKLLFTAQLKIGMQKKAIF